MSDRSEAVRELEELREDEVGELRRQGKDGEAERRYDAWTRQIDRQLALERRRSGDTRSRSKRNPTEPRRLRSVDAASVDAAAEKAGAGLASVGRAGAGAAAAGRGKRAAGAARGFASGIRRSNLARPRLTARAGRSWRQTGVPAAGASVTALALQLAGATIAMALLLVFVEDRRQAGWRYSGPQALAGLINAFAGAVRLIVDPIDPLAAATVTVPDYPPSSWQPPASDAGLYQGAGGARRRKSAGGQPNRK